VRPLAIWFGVMLAAFLWTPRASAHELGALVVEISLKERGRVEITAEVDAAHLPAALKPFPSDAFLAGAELSTDAGPVDLAMRALDATPQGPRFAGTGTLPTGAKELSWKQPLELGQYTVIISAAGQTREVWLNGPSRSDPISLAQDEPPATSGAVVRQYLLLGFTHIVPEGTDHILFVLSLFLLSLKVKPLLTQITAFTVAHSVTLGLAMKGDVSLPPSIVEPAIAASIAWMAVENITTDKCRPTRTATVFLFGLLHGMGFAGVLSELGLPDNRFAPALISFNAGVELGQLSVVSAAWLLIGWPFGKKPWYRRGIVIPASAIIALVGVYWTIERVFFAG
jgi:hypothetical protein